MLSWEMCDTNLKYGTDKMQVTALQKVKTSVNSKMETVPLIVSVEFRDKKK